MSIEETLANCMQHMSKADLKILRSDQGEHYALEWLQWAKRTGLRSLEFYTPTQTQHLAHLMIAEIVS
tara:strand:+ start:346 stop:549 length:204 start_codon:yes stop_codon:yes gene_type:complete